MTDPRNAEADVPSESKLKRGMPLVPADSIAGRALVTVIAIMTFLACLTAGGAILIAHASQGWRSDVSRDVTIQIKPRSGDDIEATVSKAVELAGRAAGVGDVHALSKAESERMLEPWLGQGLDISQLPIPRLIVVHMNREDQSGLEQLRSALAAAVPEANVDDQRLWLSRLDTMADTIAIFAGGVFVLVIVAMGTAIGFATRGAMAGNREIIEVLHFVGAADIYIARQFQAHFLRLGLRGAALGGGASMLFFAAASLSMAWGRRTTGSDEIGALFGSFSLNASGYVSIVIICAGIAGLTGALSRTIVFSHLQNLP